MIAGVKSEAASMFFRFRRVGPLEAPIVDPRRASGLVQPCAACGALPLRFRACSGAVRS